MSECRQINLSIISYKIHTVYYLHRVNFDLLFMHYQSIGEKNGF